MRSAPLLAAVAIAVVACGVPAADPAATSTPPSVSTTPPTSVVPTTVATSPTTTEVPTSTSGGGGGDTVDPLLGLTWELVAEVDGFVTGFDLAGDRVLVTTKEGLVVAIGPDGQVATIGDVSDRVRDRGEQGLLDLAVHPDHPSDRRVFLHHSDLDGDTVLVEAYLGEDLRIGGLTEVYRTSQPAGNHNGGSIEFAPDGMLILALGDGGGSGDRYGHGQRTDTPLAALLRFDVSVAGRAEAALGNPFADGPAPEVWAIGLRNPWRITFDPPSGRLVVADVGQNRVEEVTVVAADLAGANHGWPIMEGRDCHEPPTGCDRTGLVVPVVDVTHGDEGTCSITGGRVYRGEAIPELDGHYLFSDYCGGWLRSFPIDASEGVEPQRIDIARLDGPAAFGTDPAGELLVSGQDGRVLRLVPVR